MKLEKFRNAVLATIFVLFIFSLVLNIFLYSQLRKYYTLLYAIELDPLGLSYFQESTNHQNQGENQQTVVFFGDSRAARWPAPATEGFWFINRGIGNQTSAQIVNRFDEHIKPLQPDVVVLQLCINDLKTIPLFPDSKQRIVQNCKSNIQKIVRESLELNSTVVVSTVFPTGKIPLERRLVWSNDIENSITEVNDFIHTLPSNRVIVFDANEILSDNKGKMKHEYSFDELHLNEAGYQALNSEFIKLLEAIGEDY